MSTTCTLSPSSYATLHEISLYAKPDAVDPMLAYLTEEMHWPAEHAATTLKICRKGDFAE